MLQPEPQTPTPLRAANTLPNNAELHLWPWDYSLAEQPATWGNVGMESVLGWAGQGGPLA